MINQSLKEKLKQVPESPGVYILKDEAGNVLYVGKATCLSRRVSSHFNRALTAKDLLLGSQVRDLEVIPVASPAEALLLENRLIKKYQPRYNTNLKDGKSYPLVKITDESFPALCIVREEKTEKDEYYGPFTDVYGLKRLVRFLRRHYPLRSCSPAVFRRGRLCTQYHIKRCSGPCAHLISREEYSKLVEGVRAFFSGRYAQFQKGLKRKLQDAIRQLRFEEAQLLKERLQLVDYMVEKFPLRSEPELESYGYENVLAQLAGVFHLQRIPSVVEGYDISVWGKDLATGSRVTFRGGIPDKKSYRHYRIMNAAIFDDYLMLEEVLLRRFTGSDKDYPDLILVDGGKGQLSVAEKVLRRLNLRVPVVALAKEREEIYLPGQAKPLSLPLNSPVLQFLQRVRNEAHRFAVQYQKKILHRKTMASLFQGIPGLGPARLKKIKNYFPDLKTLADGEVETLKKMGIPEKAAKLLLERLASQLGKH